ncbi:MAG: hypothetical protein JNJ46_25315 [Myxococcales bacterium]|nr:hypothetical protein [Myxococcales bacterium]
MTDLDNKRFYAALTAMEQEGDEEPLDAALEERLVRRVLAERRRETMLRRTFVAAGVMAMAAALFLVFGLKWQTAPALPLYALYVSGDDKMLGSPVPQEVKQEVPQLALDSMLRVELRPADKTTEETTTLAFLRAGDTLKPWPVHPERTPSGVFLLQAPAQELGLELGQYELVFVLGRARSQPRLADVDEALRRKAKTLAGGWQLLHQPIQIVAR